MNGGRVQISDIIKNVIRHCHSKIFSLERYSVSKYTSKRMFYNNLLKTKICIAKLLILYRQNTIYNKSNGLIEKESHLESIIRDIQSSLHFFSSKNNFKCKKCALLPHNLFNGEDYLVLPCFNFNALFLIQLQAKIPDGVIITRYNDQKIVVFYPGLYKYCFRFTVSGKPALKSIRFFFEISRPHKIIISRIINLLLSSDMFIHELHYEIVRFNHYSHYSRIISDISRYENVFHFKLNIQKEHTLIVFNGNFSPHNTYKVSFNQYGVFLFSLSTLNFGDNQDSFYKINILESNKTIEETLSEIKYLSLYTRLSQVAQRLKHAVTSSGVYPFDCYVKNHTIHVYLLSRRFFTVEMNPINGEPIVNVIWNVGISNSELLHTMNCKECERATISNSLYIAAAYKEILTNTLGMHSEYIGLNMRVRSKYQRLLQFSFAPDFYLYLYFSNGRPHMRVLTSEWTQFLTNETLDLESIRDSSIYESLVNSAFSTKSIMLMLQLRHNLSKNNISALFENNTVHFQYEVFACVEFQVKNNNVWNLLFNVQSFANTHNMQLRFYGKDGSSRFAEWIYSIVKIVSSYINALNCIYGLHYVFKAVEYKIDGLSLSFHNPGEQSFRTIIQFGSPLYEYRSEPNYYVYQLDSALSHFKPQIFGNSFISRNISRSLNNMNHAHFGITIYKSLHVSTLLHRLFILSPSEYQWSIIESSFERITLIFNNMFSFVVFFECCLEFRVHIPMSENYQVFNYAFEDIKKGKNFQNVKLKSSDLEEAKNNIEFLYKYYSNASQALPSSRKSFLADHISFDSGSFSFRLYRNKAELKFPNNIKLESQISEMLIPYPEDLKAQTLMSLAKLGIDHIIQLTSTIQSIPSKYHNEIFRTLSSSHNQYEFSIKPYKMANRNNLFTVNLADSEKVISFNSVIKLFENL